MDFDLSKENIQPLRGGRNASQLGMALQAQNNAEHQQELQEQKRRFEDMINTYTGDDPLHNWYHYIYWLEQCFPKHGHEGNFLPILEHCLGLFEADPRYLNDRRLCKLMIKYIDMQQHQEELFQMIYSNGIGRGCADIYKAWAYYHELSGDFHKAHNIFELGIKELAQPMDELLEAKEYLVKAAGEHMLFGRDNNALFDRRHALTSLATYKPGRVGSVRIPTAQTPGTFGVGSPSQRHSSNNSAFPVFEQRQENPLASIGGTTSAPFSVIQAAKRLTEPKENTHKAGPWTTGPIKKRPSAHQRCLPSFTVHEDGTSEEAVVEVLPKFPAGTMESYEAWLVPMTIPEPQEDRRIPMYPKSKVYELVGVEFSLEELRARRYKNNIVDEDIQIIDDQEIEQSPVMEVCSSSPNLSYNLSEHVLNPVNQHPEQYNHEHQNKQSPGQFDMRFDIWTEDSPILNMNRREKVLNETTRLDLWTTYQAKSEESSPIPNRAAFQQNEQEHGRESKFVVYEQPSFEEYKSKAAATLVGGSAMAMKTPFKNLTVEELAETGSLGGMDVAAAAPVDSAKRLPCNMDDAPQMDNPYCPILTNDDSMNTQMFNLNAMIVSTPNNEKTSSVRSSWDDDISSTKKQLFSSEDCQRDKAALGTIYEETSKSQSSSGTVSSNAALSCGKSLLTQRSTPASTPINIPTAAAITEEHHKNLAQNLKANEELRRSLYDSFMRDDEEVSPPRQPTIPQQNGNKEIGHSFGSTDIGTKCSVIGPSDPFSPKLIASLLSKLGFPGPHTHNYYTLSVVPKLAMRKEVTCIGPDRYLIDKLLGKGTFGVVYKGEDLSRRQAVALKYQKPSSKWEFYICRELHLRLLNNLWRDRFMNVTSGYFSDSASILISDYVPSGSLLDVANSIKQKSGRPMKECLCIHFCLEMIRIVRAMHSAEIIHADLKPDNFLVKVISTGNGETVALQLIDFGCAIDMSLLPAGIEFTRKITTEDFTCCEMLDNRPWNYHTDLFCIAATAHVLLFDKYIRMQKRDGLWSICQKLPRYTRVDLWNEFFYCLLNQQQGPANTQHIETMLLDHLNSDDYLKEIRYLTNILKNR